MWKKILTICVLSLLISPVFCLASESFKPGTDEYLKAGGLTEEQLTADVSTEDREPFISASGETSATDPTGDVLSRSGTHPGINFGWGDLTEASLKKDETKQCWDFSLKVAEQIPSAAPWQANYLLYIDSDGKIDNNTPIGVRINTDYEISIKYEAEKSKWSADLRWYNPEPDFWAVNKETASTFEFKNDSLSICVPFTEISTDIVPTWRVAAVISDGQNTQVDVAPGVGFPPPKGETYPTWGTNNSDSTNFTSLINWRSLVIVGGIAALIGLIKLVFWLIGKKSAPVASSSIRDV
ncbi:MAG: hypothetical protein V1716_02645 [Candidatus Uhrbacteria bacterium]